MLQLYKNIKNRRIALGLSQDELAQKTGYTSRSSIAKIESGKVDLPQTKIKLFAEALETTQADLMGWDIENSDASRSLSNIDYQTQRKFLCSAKLPAVIQSLLLKI